MTAVVATEDQFEQLIRLLAENPDLRARLRGALVGEELADFTERLARIAELQERSEKGMVELEERMRSWIASMQQHVEFLREMNAEDRRRQQEFGAYFEALLARMGERIDAINASIAAQAEQDARLGMRMDQLTARIDSLTERMDQLTARVDSLTVRMDQLTARVDSLTERMEQLTARVDDLTQQVQQLTVRMDQLTARVDSLTERMEQLTARVDDLTQQVQQLTVRMDQLTARVDSLTERMEQLTARVDDLTQQVQQLTVRMDQLTARVDSLTERMEQLTARVDDLTQQVQQLTVRMDQLTARVDSLTERMDQLTARVDQLTVDTQRLTGEFGKLKGWQLEERYFRRAPAYFAPILRRIRALSPEELAELLDSLENAGQLSEAEGRDIQNADVVVRGRDRETGEERYLLVEVSVGVGLEDVERAARRANLLARALNVPVLPVVAGEYFRAEAMRAANELGVWKVLDGGCEPPKGDGSDKN
jgi:chromosome segregation ATPase